MRSNCLLCWKFYTAAEWAETTRRFPKLCRGHLNEHYEFCLRCKLAQECCVESNSDSKSVEGGAS